MIRATGGRWMPLALLCAVLCFVGAARAHDIVHAPGAARESKPAVSDFERTRPRITKRLDPDGTMTQVTVVLPTDGGDIVLDLVPAALLERDASLVRHTREEGSIREGSATLSTRLALAALRGSVRGAPGSSVAASLDGGVLQGIALLDSDVILFEPAARFEATADPNETAVYSLSNVDTDIPGVAVLRERLRESSRSTVAAAERQISGATPAVLELAAVADYEYFVRHAGESETRMMSILNLVDTVFRDQLNLTLSLSHIEVFETENDPFTEFSSPNLFNNFRNAALEFGAWRADNGGSAATAGLAHLFSDRALGLTNGGAGFGFIDSLCDVRDGVSISTTKFFDSIPLHALILSHELGHNFGADHDGDPSGSCPDAPQGFIMQAAAAGSRFSACSKAVMTAAAEAASCVASDAPRCAQPISAGALPTAGDCLYILQAAVFVRTCDPACQCAPKGSLPVSATDALICLRAAVGSGVALNCPC